LTSGLEEVEHHQQHGGHREEDRQHLDLLAQVREPEMTSLDVNLGKSAVSFYRQVAALVPDMFCNFYLVQNHKIANNSATSKAREKISTFGILRIL
jgi:hypothetical protein